MRLSFLIIFFSYLSFCELVETFPNGIKKYDFSAELNQVAILDSTNHFYLYDLENEEIIRELQLTKDQVYGNYDFLGEGILDLSELDPLGDYYLIRLDGSVALFATNSASHGHPI